MKVEYVHASRFGNGAAVADEFRRRMAVAGVEVDVHHVKEVRAMELGPADLYVFSSPGRMGKPARAVRRFLRDLRLPAGARYAVLTTEMAPRPDRKTGHVPTEEELAGHQRVRPIMHELLRDKGLVSLGEGVVDVIDLKGPLEEGWQAQVATFADLVVDATHSTGTYSSPLLRDRRHGAVDPQRGDSHP